MSDVKSMDKDALKAYVAKNHPGVTLDMREKVENLRERVANLDAETAEKQAEAKITAPANPQTPAPAAVAAPGAKSHWVQNPETGLAFHVNDPVAKAHPSWPACDKEGKLIG